MNSIQGSHCLCTCMILLLPFPPFFQGIRIFRTARVASAGSGKPLPVGEDRMRTMAGQQVEGDITGAMEMYWVETVKCSPQDSLTNHLWFTHWCCVMQSALPLWITSYLFVLPSAEIWLKWLFYILPQYFGMQHTRPSYFGCDLRSLIGLIEIGKPGNVDLQLQFRNSALI